LSCFSHACLISHSNLILLINGTPHTLTYTGYGGGGGGGGVYKHEATTVNYDDSMTINVDGGARGNGDEISGRRGFAGSVGKVYLVSRLSFFFSYS